MRKRPRPQRPVLLLRLIKHLRRNFRRRQLAPPTTTTRTPGDAANQAAFQQFVRRQKPFYEVRSGSVRLLIFLTHDESQVGSYFTALQTFPLLNGSSEHHAVIDTKNLLALVDAALEAHQWLLDQENNPNAIGNRLTHSLTLSPDQIV